MNKVISRFILILFVVAAWSVASVRAQNEPDLSGHTKAEQDDFPKSVKDMFIKTRIEREKKDFEELLARGEEAAKLSGEVDESFVQNKRFTTEDRKKLEQLEKISKKIREELGASDDDGADNVKISSTSDAVEKLKKLSANLAEELKKTSRYTISAVAVQTSNDVLRIVRFIKSDKN